MTCGSASEAILDLARGVAMPGSVRRAVYEHVRTCAGCAGDLARHEELTAALQSLSAEAQSWIASPEIEGRLEAAFAAHLGPDAAMAPSDRQNDRWVYALALAAVIALAVWIGKQPPRRPVEAARTASVPRGDVKPPPIAPGPPAMEPAPSRTAAPAVKRGRRPNRRPPVQVPQVRSVEFVTIPSAVGLPDLESGSVVRVELPVAALPGYGVELAPNVLNTTVQADVLVGQDGQPRAIRLITAEEESAADTRSKP